LSCVTLHFTNYPTEFPDENFDKKPNSALKRSEKGQTGYLKARKKPNFACGTACLLSFATKQSYKYITRNFLQN